MWIFRNWTISAEKRTFRCLTRNSSGCGLLWSLVVVLTGVGLLIGNRNFAEGTRTLWWLNVHPLSSVPGHPGVQLQRLTRSHPCPCIGQSVCHSVRGYTHCSAFCAAIVPCVLRIWRIIHRATLGARRSAYWTAQALKMLSEKCLSFVSPTACLHESIARASQSFDGLVVMTTIIY